MVKDTLFTDEEKLKEAIIRLKKRKEAVILAHNYQISQIQDVADFVGDSLELAKISAKVDASLIVFCGVYFMGETAKILSPQKKVLIPVVSAGCPLADTIIPKKLLELKNVYPEAWVVSYVNTSAEIKALTDVCCTSSNAVQVVKNIPAKKVIFVPDKNLGWWIKRNVPQKEIILWEGFCYVHQNFTLDDLHKLRSKFPYAQVFVHPECKPEILQDADLVLSTSGMLSEAKKSSAKEIIIGTEEGLIYRLKKENPEKKFYPLKKAECVDMKKITLKELYLALEYQRYAIELSPQIIQRAQNSLREMIKYT
ncbi:MAG: quinolinate synthase [Candidatus Omnitrophota bacterium]|nr:MAG: quinolinate synthase [Candidatus Omnitrophota bacterium]